MYLLHNQTFSTNYQKSQSWIKSISRGDDCLGGISGKGHGDGNDGVFVADKVGNTFTCADYTGSDTTYFIWSYVPVSVQEISVVCNRTIC